MLFRDHLEGDHVFSLESCVDEDEIGTEVFVQDVGMGWCSSENAENIRHALALH